MREIKFRAWDREKKEILLPENFTTYEFGKEEYDIDIKRVLIEATGKVLTWNDAHGFCEPTVSPGGNRFILMQFTGLKDKNGKEIYEGDVVKWATLISRLEYRASVQFEEREGCWILWDGNPNKEQHRLTSGASSRCEVIGNIYENPELVNK